MLHPAYSREKGRLRAELPLSRVICPNSHVLLSHRPRWWGTATQILCCRTIWMQNQTSPSHQSHDPVHEACYAAQGKQQCFALGLEWHPVVQWLQRFLLKAENSQVPSTGVSGAQHRDGMAWDGMKWDGIHLWMPTSMGCRQFSKRTPEIPF